MRAPKTAAYYISPIEIGLLWANRYEIDFSNQELNIDFCQGATKISEVKVGGWKKKSASSASGVRASVSNLAESADFFDL